MFFHTSFAKLNVTGFSLRDKNTLKLFSSFKYFQLVSWFQMKREWKNIKIQKNLRKQNKMEGLSIDVATEKVKRAKVDQRSEKNSWKIRTWSGRSKKRDVGRIRKTKIRHTNNLRNKVASNSDTYDNKWVNDTVKLNNKTINSAPIAIYGLNEVYTLNNKDSFLDLSKI